MGPQNGIMGNTFGTELPESFVDDSVYEEMQKTARFSKTAEFKELKKYLDTRMDFYRNYLPDGKPVIASGLNATEVGELWIAANIVIGELMAIINVYEGAAQEVKDEAARRARTKTVR